MMSSVIKMAGGIMKYFVSMVTLLAFTNVFAANQCLLTSNVDHPECNRSGTISNVWICINHRETDNGTNLPSFNVSGSASAVGVDEICGIERKSTGCGSKQESIETICGDHVIHTWVEPELIADRQGHAMNLHVQVDQTESICELSFVRDASIAKPQKRADEEPNFYYGCP